MENQPQVRSIQSAVSSEPRHSIKFSGEGLLLFLMMLVNGLLTVCTLGIYHFWGKVKIRKYIWQNVELDGSRFEFFGTGKELLIGWLKVMGIFMGGGMIMGFATVAFGPGSPVTRLLTLMFYVGVMVIMPFAIVGARRYMLSRTTWKNIHFSFLGDGGELMGPFVKGTLLTMVTLGFYGPHFTSDLYGYLINKSTYGTRPFKYDGNGSDLMGPYVKAFLLTIPTLGLSWVWYAAERTRYLRAHTTSGGIRFHSTVTGGALLGLRLTNVLLVIFTLGIGLPWAVIRAIRFECENLHLRGVLDLSDVGESNDRGSAMGEELASHLDLDAGFVA